MKNFCTLYVFLFVCFSARSQEYLNSQRFIPGTSEKDDSATAIEVMNDEVMIAGNVNNLGTGVDAVINKYMPDGTLIWSGGYVSSFGDEVKSFQCNYHDFTFAVGSTGKTKNRDALIFALDDKGGNLWSKTFKGSFGGNDGFLGIKTAPDSSFVVVGQTTTAAGVLALIAEYNENGNLLWSKLFGSSGENAFNNIEFDGDGNIFVSGFAFNGTNRDGVIAEYDINGKFLQSILINGAGNGDDEVNALELENGLLYAAIAGPGGGPHTATAINAHDPTNLNKVVWSQKYGGGNFGFSVAGSFQCNLLGDLLISGTRDSSTSTRFTALSFNALTGSFNWASIIGPELTYNYQAVANTLDASNNFVITGIRTSAPAPFQGGCQIFTTSCDSKGAVLWTKQYDGLIKRNNSPSGIGVNDVAELFIAGQTETKDQNGIISDDMVLLKYSDKQICLVPTGLSLLDTFATSAKVAWDPMPEAVKYKVQYREHKIGSWINVNAKSTSATFTNLTPGTEYDWRAETVCSTNPSVVSGYSGIQTFKTAAAFSIASAMANQSMNAGNFHLYPNPAIKTISVDLANGTEKIDEVKILDLSGKQVLAKEFKSSSGPLHVQFDISPLKAGSYIVTATSSHSTFSQLLIKQ